MTTTLVEAITPSILVVDDERQIHSSLRLRLGELYRVTCHSNPREALGLIRQQAFDLCIADVHMPGMDGLTFIEAARGVDPALGFVVLSGHDSDENLRRAIPLQVFDFIPKPLPDRAGFEARIPDWIASTRRRRQELTLAKASETIVHDLELARIERDVETTASDSAREALLQTASLLTTIQALLLNTKLALDTVDRKDPKLTTAFRSLLEAQRHAEQAAAITDSYFASAYADRSSSPAVIDPCLRHGVGIALRRAKADARSQNVDLTTLGRDLTVSGLTGIDFLLMFVPALIQALDLSGEGTTVQVRCEEISRLEEAVRDLRWRQLFWVNRRNATSSSPGVALTIRTNGVALDDAGVGEWLRGHPTDILRIPGRGILQGILKAKGLLGIATRPHNERFELVMALPV
jgi:CheY-like chemotaxis protein